MRVAGLALATLMVAVPGLLAGAAAGRAQPRGAQRPGAPPPRVAPDLNPSPPRTGPLARHPGPVLDAEQARRLLQAQAMRETGRMDAAREALLALLAEVPHQPLVLVELARVYAIEQRWGPLERLARAERGATRDSLLLGRELSLALERQGRPREAAQVVLEVWVAAPEESDWAEATLSRLDDLEPRAAREALRRAAEARPARTDLALAAARLEWRHRDGPAARRLLAATDATGPSTPARWTFAQELLQAGTARDSSGAFETLLGLAGEPSLEPAYRLSAARRAWQVAERGAGGPSGVLRISQALADLQPAAWAPDLLLGIVRSLREAGHTAEVRSLLDRLGERRSAHPELALEGALNDLREGPPARALPVLEKAVRGFPEGVFRYAEALFYAGLPDSAMVIFDLLSKDPASPFAGPSLERLFLIEDAEPRAALPALGRMAYETWRGQPRRAAAIAESLYRDLPRGPLWAYAALALADHREGEGDGRAALEPLLAVADSLPDDRLAPVARQRAGDVYRLRLKDDARALAQYEECLARYPKAWNAPEVRRVVQTLRRERRF